MFAALMGEYNYVAICNGGPFIVAEGRSHSALRPSGIPLGPPQMFLQLGDGVSFSASTSVGGSLSTKKGEDYNLGQIIQKLTGKLKT